MKARSERVLTKKQQRAFDALVDALVGLVRQGYEAGLDAGWVQLALWHASDRVEGLPPLSERLAPLTPGAGSPIVKRASRKKKND